jgi:hypothetical protein
VRDWLNGSTANQGNHWVEIEVWGRTSTAYIGNYYEWTGSTSSSKKYYYAGSVRVAVRTGTGSLATGLTGFSEIISARPMSQQMGMALIQ